MRLNRGVWIAAATVSVMMTLIHACGAVDDRELGLSKTSVFSTPDPIVATMEAKEPGESEPLEPYFSGSPPVIPHQVEDFLPIQLENNLCLDCHDQPDQIGEEREEGEPTPIPASHYTDLRHSPEQVTQELIGARFVCTQCHAPQTGAEPLVVNTYEQ